MTLSRPSPSDTAAFTVIIPAHNEERVIGRTLGDMLSGWIDRPRPRVMVICNGCTDETARVAREAAPEAEVIELDVASKVAAINAGIERTTAFPVIVVDADVSIAPASLRALADALREPGVMATSPRARIDTTSSDRWTRAYYRVWQAHSYLASGVGGAGVYGLSEEGAKRLGPFPPIINDDSYVRCCIDTGAQRRVANGPKGPVFARVRAPASVGSLLACETRWHAGNVELRHLGLAEPGAGAPTTETDAIAPSPKPSDRLIHLAIKAAGRLLYIRNRLLGRQREWHRDTDRSSPGGTES